MEDRRNCSFQIHHPKKSFVVVAESPEMKRVWMRDINEARAAGRKSTERETQLGAYVYICVYICVYVFCCAGGWVCMCICVYVYVVARRFVVTD